GISTVSIDLRFLVLVDSGARPTQTREEAMGVALPGSLPRGADVSAEGRNLEENLQATEISPTISPRLFRTGMWAKPSPRSWPRRANNSAIAGRRARYPPSMV